MVLCRGCETGKMKTAAQVKPRIRQAFRMGRSWSDCTPKPPCPQFLSFRLTGIFFTDCPSTFPLNRIGIENQLSNEHFYSPIYGVLQFPAYSAKSIVKLPQTARKYRGDSHRTMCGEAQHSNPAAVSSDGLNPFNLAKVLAV
jgi:hypothetical protein